MAHAARALGLGVMLGCMVESGLGIAAGCGVAQPLRPRRPRRQPAARRRPVARRRARGRRPGARRRRPGLGVRQEAARSSLRAARATRTTARRCAASLALRRSGRSSRSSTRRARGRRTTASRSSARSTTRSASGRRPRSSASPPRAAGSRRRGASCSELHRARGSTSRTACTSSSRDDAELVELAGRHGVELRDLRKPPAGLNVPTGANLELPARIVLTVGSDCAIGKMTVSLELDREARARGLALRVRADRPDGDRDRRLGHRRRRGRLRLPRRRGGAARRRGAERGGELLLGRGPGVAAAPRVLGRHARADARLARRTRSCSATSPGRPRSRATRATRCRRSPELVELHERIALPAPAGEGRGDRAEHARPRRGGARAAIAAAPRRRRGCRPTTRCASAPGRLAGRRARACAVGLERPRPDLTANTCSCILSEHMFARLVLVVAARRACLGGVARSSDASGQSSATSCRPYDTLWSIAARTLRGDPREAVWRAQSGTTSTGTTDRARGRCSCCP